MGEGDTGLIISFGCICRDSVVSVLLFLRVGSRGGGGDHLGAAGGAPSRLITLSFVVSSRESSTRTSWILASYSAFCR